MGLIGIFAIVFLAFLAIDAVMLKMVMFPLFQRHIADLFRDQMQMGVALAFYAFYAAGLIYIAVLPALAEEKPSIALINGAVVGFMAYGTYEATNMATLRGWSWEMVATDLTWGTFLSALVAGIGYVAGRYLL